MDVHQLVKAAIAARESAYAPYSKYQVGAAVLVDDGRVFSGCNVENASYGLTICAERAAICAAVAAGARHLQAIAIATQNGAAPCGACRQVIKEFADRCAIHLATPDGTHVTMELDTLLPRAFGPRSL